MGYPKAQPAIKNQPLLVKIFNVEFSNLRTMRSFFFDTKINYYFRIIRIGSKIMVKYVSSQRYLAI
jgi:hypothetical protein